MDRPGAVPQLISARGALNVAGTEIAQRPGLHTTGSDELSVKRPDGSRVLLSL